MARKYTNFSETYVPLSELITTLYKEQQATNKRLDLVYSRLNDVLDATNMLIGKINLALHDDDDGGVPRDLIEEYMYDKVDDFDV